MPVSLFLSRSLSFSESRGSPRGRIETGKGEAAACSSRGKRESDKWLPEEVSRLRKLSEDTRESISLKDP